MAMRIAEWKTVLIGIDAKIIKLAIEYCKCKLEWPPNAQEFSTSCDLVLGVPEVAASFKDCLNRKFTHPVSKLAFVQVGDWDFKNLDEKSLRKRFDESYVIALDEYRSDRKYYDEWFINEQVKVKSKLPKNDIQHKAAGSIAKFYISQAKKKTGCTLTQEEEENIKFILEKNSLYADPYEGMTDEQIYEKIRKEREDEGMRHYAKVQSMLLKSSKETHNKSSITKSWMNRYE